MPDRTDPDIGLLHEVPTRLADIREFQRELVAAAETPGGPGAGGDAPEPATLHALRPPPPAWGQDELEPPGSELLDAFAQDDLPTRHIQLPGHRSASQATPHLGLRAEHTPVPVETTAARTPSASLRPWMVGVAVCLAVAVNAGFLLGLYLEQDRQGTPRASVAKRAEPVARAAAPPSGASASPAAVRSVAVLPAVEITEAAAAPELDGEPSIEESPLGAARRAIEGADREAAAAALARARRAEVEPASLDRLRARLAVLRGEGAEAVSQLRSMVQAYPGDAQIQLALARTLAQAERDGEAERAFRRVLELDPHSVDAHVGLARLATRGTRLGAARGHLGSAREAFDRAEPDAVLEARLYVTEGIIAFELGDYAAASSHADRALALDPESAEAQLLLGRVAIEQGRDATEHLRAAVAGRAPPAEALGMLVPRAGADACALADRYLAIAPRGFDARTVRSLRSRCR